jgi:hypothetical protein
MSQKFGAVVTRELIKSIAVASSVSGNQILIIYMYGHQSLKAELDSSVDQFHFLSYCTLTLFIQLS